MIKVCRGQWCSPHLSSHYGLIAGITLLWRHRSSFQTAPTDKHKHKIIVGRRGPTDTPGKPLSGVPSTELTGREFNQRFSVWLKFSFFSGSWEARTQNYGRHERTDCSMFDTVMDKRRGRCSETVVSSDKQTAQKQLLTSFSAS